MTRFAKMHGLGNDFVILDAREEAVAIDAARARGIADRRTGIGCDQVILLEPSEVADVRMRIWNADGGEVEACGNAARCVALLEGGETAIETKGGIVRANDAFCRALGYSRAELRAIDPRTLYSDASAPGDGAAPGISKARASAGSAGTASSQSPSVSWLSRRRTIGRPLW